VQPRDHLRDAGGAAGQLEYRDVIGVDATLDILDDRARGPRIGASAQRLDRDLAGVPGGSEDQRVAQGRVIPPLLGGEANQVEAARPRLHQVSDRADPAADLADLVAAVRRERADRHQSRLEDRVPGQDRAEPVGDLEQHRITWHQPEPGQPGGQDIGALVELAVGHPAVERHDRFTLRVHGRHGVQLVGDGAGTPQARSPV
jgi:hypothetical protein